MTYEGWLEYMLEEIPDDYQKTPGFPVYDLIAAWALVAERLETELEDAKLLLDPENLTGIALETYVYDRTGLERIDGEFASGTLTVTGSGTIAAGTYFISDSGLSFYTTTDETISGSGDISVVCSTMGDAGNVPAGTITTFAQTVLGFTSVTNASAMTGGADEETDAELLDRFYLKMRTPPTSGNIYAYKEWALEIAGVGSVKVFPLGHGDGTVDVTITSDSGGVASAALVAEVQEYIDPNSTGEGRGVAPIGAKCYVSSATSSTVDISASVTLDGTVAQSDVNDALQTAITELFADTFDTGTVKYRDVANVFADMDGVSDFEDLLIDSASQSITLGSTACATIGTWSITYT